MPDHEIISAHADSAIPHVGTYRRMLPISLERMYENTLDWEHLPFVHESSFASIECLDAGSWGWRARVVSARGDPSVIELRLDRDCRRWITRTLEGANVGSEIWTHAFPIADQRVDIVVDFFIPGIAAEHREKAGQAFARLYSRLYDEDVDMMVERQTQLDKRIQGVRGGGGQCALGPRAELALPLVCRLDGVEYALDEVEGQLLAYPVLCPHLLGPLDTSSLDKGVVTCHWHGYRFDVTTGECVSGQSCRMTRLPRITEIDGEVVLHSPT